MDDPVKVYFCAERALKLAANDAAQAVGLTTYAEYIRIALQHLVEHRTLPDEFKGKRSVINRGRPDEGARA